jgi:hypothetical protein
MAGDLDRFPGIESAIDAADGIGQLAAERSNLIVNFGRFRLSGIERANPLFDLMDRLLEGQAVSGACHGGSER